MEKINMARTLLVGFASFAFTGLVIVGSAQGSGLLG